MGVIKALFNIIGGSASIATGEPTRIVSGICSVGLGTIEMKDVVSEFLAELADAIGTSVLSAIDYVDRYYRTGEDPRQVMRILLTIRQMLRASGKADLYNIFEEQLKLYVKYKKLV